MRPRCHLSPVERCVEQHAKRAERLPAPLWAKTDQDHVTVTVMHVQCRRVALQVLLSQEIA